MTCYISGKVDIAPESRVAEVGGPQDRRSTKGQGLLRKKIPPTYAILLLSIVAIYALFERLLESSQRKSSRFRRTLSTSHAAFVEHSTKVILLSTKVSMFSEGFQQK